MQPRTLDQILGELNATYNPQIDNIRKRQAEIPNAIAAEEQGLQAKQTSAYDEIVGGARRRGLGFSGIPVGEQYKYNATEYMPALARLRQSGRDQALSLEDAINKVYESRNTFGNQLFQNEQQLFESRRQFDTQQAFAREQEANRLREAAAARAASLGAAGGGGFAPSMGGGGGPAAPTANGAAAKPTTLSGGKTVDDAARALQQLLSTRNSGIIRQTLSAIQASAARGNTYDQAKLRLVNSRPEFKQYLANFNGATY